MYTSRFLTLAGCPGEGSWLGRGPGSPTNFPEQPPNVGGRRSRVFCRRGLGSDSHARPTRGLLWSNRLREGRETRPSGRSLSEPAGSQKPIGLLSASVRKHHRLGKCRQEAVSPHPTYNRPEGRPMTHVADCGSLPRRQHTSGGAPPFLWVKSSRIPQKSALLRLRTPPGILQGSQSILIPNPKITCTCVRSTDWETRLASPVPGHTRLRSTSLGGLPDPEAYNLPAANPVGHSRPVPLIDRNQAPPG